ncbi:hypothetical protein HMPREF0591_4509 [Mycobacterium parascrofulaceum ATCC BAA-614]|uniref:Uncharacterized protein n=1 Tax=Mycobacterium parascrofulaceum ATCC BAA-614 TaxID=525368 RepID=D5PEM2_9MYCO|nr:hypothetical protein HMPREF0591_4509 [Mycobacterium parascrofulaceum ATCC BAA-614]
MDRLRVHGSQAGGTQPSTSAFQVGGQPVALTLSQARSVYDRIGRMQDWQGFYEDATTERLVAGRPSPGARQFSSSVAALVDSLRTY